MVNRRPQRGLTLIELLFAMALAAFVVAGLNSVLTLGLQAQASGRQANELVYQARFALDRMAAKARSTAPRLVSAAPSGTTGDWFSPAMYCLNASNSLVETIVSDTGCTAGAAIANNVTAFSAQLPAGAGPVDRPSASLSLTLQTAGAPAAVTLSASVRLGGGAL
jgi:prepilin-type N-terminal cleavage/methylation domain-containing protein